MAKVTFIEHDGSKHVIEIENGLSVMQGAVENNIPGIDADCGGSCACSTCHVYVHPEWINRIPKKDDMEEDMLDFAYEPNKKFSRLTCKIIVNDALDGIIVKMPKRQI
tara:strand:+ start:726 stop:1049 length:324 start_codon:yes stop_codon:yes gene_type:complete